LAVFVFSSLALLSSRRHLAVGLGASLLIVSAGTGYGIWRLALPELTAEPVKVRIVQPSIDQAEKWNAEIRSRIFRRHLELSSADPEGTAAQLIVWPETSVPFLFSERPEALQDVARMLDEG